MPAKTPVILAAVILSLPEKKCATITVVNGVIPLSIDASPPEMCVCPQVMSENGSAFAKNPIMANAIHICGDLGMVLPVAAMTAHNTTAPKNKRAKTMVSGGNSRTAALTKKNEPPHTTESVTNIAHADLFMVVPDIFKL